MPTGLLVPGTIDPFDRAHVQNPDGTYSTLRTITIAENGRVVLLPTVIDGRVVTTKEAVDHYHQTGEHLGIFADERSAQAYDTVLHEQIRARTMPQRRTSMAMPDDESSTVPPGPPGPLADPKDTGPGPNLYGIPIDEFRRLVTQYQQNRFGGGPLSRPGTAITRQDVLGQGLNDRMMNQGIDQPPAPTAEAPDVLGKDQTGADTQPDPLTRRYGPDEPAPGANWQTPGSMVPVPFQQAQVAMMQPPWEPPVMFHPPGWPSRPGPLPPVGNPIQPPQARQRLIAQMLRRPPEEQGA